MPVLHIDLSELSGIEPELIPIAATVDIWPYRPYVSGSAIVSADKIKLDLPLGVADVTLPVTPAGQGLWVQVRRVRGIGKPWLIAMPSSDKNLSDLAHLDPTSLDPEAPLDPAWVTALEALAEVVDGLPTLPVAQADVTGLPAALAGKANASDVVPVVPKVAPVIYGNSLADERNGGVVPSIVPTAAEMWPNRVATALDIPAPRNYAVGGTRSLDLLFGLLSASAAPGCSAPRAGAQWAGAAANPDALVFVEDMGNDISHFLGASSPVAISGTGGDRYLAAMQNIREAIYAVLSSQDVIQLQTGASGVTFGTGWLDKNLTVDYVKGAKVSYTWTAGEYVDVVIPAAKIAQTGPLAGKVFVGLIQYDPTTFGNAAVDAIVDGTLVTTWTPVSWEANGATVNSYGGFMVDLPVDGAPHTLRLRHAGTSGTELMTLNAIFCMSATPNTIFAKDGSSGTKVGTYVPTPAHATTWYRNRDLVTARAVRAVEKFENVHWVETKIPSGLTSADGLHPGSEGMKRHAVDTLDAVRRTLLQTRTGVRDQVSKLLARAVSQTDADARYVQPADVYSRTVSDGQYVGGVAVIGGSGTSDDRAALATADTAASSSRPILFRGPGTYRIASNFTTTAPVIIQPGAKIKPDSGVVVKIGRVLASDGQCFDHSAGGIVAPTRVDHYLPQWWGAVGTADDTLAWAGAIAAANAVKVTDSVTARDMMQRILAPVGINRFFGLTINSCSIVTEKGSSTFAPPTTSTSGSMLTLGPLSSVRGGYWRTNTTGGVTLLDVQGARCIISDALVEPRATGSVGINLGSGSSLTPTVANTEIIGVTKLGKGLVVNSADSKISNLTLAQCLLGIDWQRGAARVSNLHAWGNATGMSGNPDGIEGVNWFVESNDGWGIDWNSADLNMLTNLRLWNNGAGVASTGGMRLLHSGFGTRANKIDATVDDNVGDGILIDGSSANILNVQVASRLRNAGSAAVQTNGIRITATSGGGAVSAGNKIIAKGRSTDVTGSVVSNASASTDIDMGSVKSVLAADVVVNNTVNPSTLLGVPMERGEKWLIEGVVMVDSSQVADFKVRLQATSMTGATGRFALNSPVGASNTSLTAASMNPSNAQSIATTGGTYVTSGALGVSVAQAVTISGYVETGTADGTLELHASQNTADPTNTTFRAGSWLRASRIA